MDVVRCAYPLGGAGTALRAPGAAMGERPRAHLGRQTRSHLGSSGEVKANVEPASSILFSLLPGDFRPHRRGGAKACGSIPLATSTYLAHAVPMTGILQAWRHVGSVWRAQDTEGAVLGVKPNKPNATDYQQPLTAQEAPGKPPTNTMGTRRDSHRKSLIQLLIWNYRYEVLP